MERPGVSDLLIQSALDAVLLERLRTHPDDVFAEYDLSEEERETLRMPDERMLKLLGRAVRQAQSERELDRSAEVDDSSREAALLEPPMILPNTLPPMLLALTVVPCVGADGLTRYAVWVNPMAEGTVPATLPPPAGATLPGTPLAPLYAVIEIDGVQASDGTGNTQLELWAQFRQATNSETGVGRGNSKDPAVEEAVAAVRGASPQTRRDRLVDLARTLQGARP